MKREVFCMASGFAEARYEEGFPMVRHIVIFTWLEDVGGEQVEGFRQALTRMASELTDLAVIRHGPDLRFRPGNGDYALIATFSNKASWDAYQAHPIHKAFVRDFVMPLQASRQTIQFSVETFEHDPF